MIDIGDVIVNDVVIMVVVIVAVVIVNGVAAGDAIFVCVKGVVNTVVIGDMLIMLKYLVRGYIIMNGANDS